MQEDEQRRQDDDDEKYIPPLTKMKGFMYFVFFVGFSLLVIINDSTVTTDPLIANILPIILAFIVIAEIGTRIVKARSPKFIGNIYGDSIATTIPVEIPAQGAWPDMGIWFPGSVDGAGVKTYLTTNCYAVFPTALAIVQGRNLDANVYLRKYVDHDILPPHIRTALRRMVKPAYKRDIPVIHGYYPRLTNKLTKADTAALVSDAEEKLGVSPAKSVKLLEIFEHYANIASPFRYKEELTNTKGLPTLRIEELSADNAKKDKQIAYWQDYSGTLEDKLRRQREPIGPSLVERMGRRDEAHDQDG